MIARIVSLALTLFTTACGSTTADTHEPRPRIDVTWTNVSTDSGVLRVAVARPSGPGPFPAVLILHGTHGFAEEYVELARVLADAGVLSYAACWFDGGMGEGRQFITPIECPEARGSSTLPTLSDSVSRESRSMHS